MTTSLTAVSSALDIPDLPDRARMYRESGARLRASMADNGIDALILLILAQTFRDHSPPMATT